MHPRRKAQGFSVISNPSCTAVFADAVWQLHYTEKRNTQCPLSAFWEIMKAANTNESSQEYTSLLKELPLGSGAFDVVGDSGTMYFATFLFFSGGSISIYPTVVG